MRLTARQNITMLHQSKAFSYIFQHGQTEQCPVCWIILTFSINLVGGVSKHCEIPVILVIGKVSVWKFSPSRFSYFQLLRAFEFLILLPTSTFRVFKPNKIFRAVKIENKNHIAATTAHFQVHQAKPSNTMYISLFPTFRSFEQCSFLGQFSKKTSLNNS